MYVQWFIILLLLFCILMSASTYYLQLAVPGRHIVFSGELDFVKNWKWIKAWVVLMNDMLLITQIEAEDHVTVVCNPVILKDVLTTEFECLHRKLHYFPFKNVFQPCNFLSIQVSKTRKVVV